jgi:hypothetical protein
MNGRLLTSLLTVLTLTGVQAQTSPATPRLVVGLTIDRLRSDYMEAFASLYGEKGFRRLQREGRVYRQAEFPFAAPDRAAAAAAVHTGATPSMNGIIGGQWLDAGSLRPIDATEDAAYLGYYTGENASPAKLLASTIADELKVATEGKALVYAVSPFRDAAIFGAGHAADGAFWLNDMTGKWCGSTYYTDFPDWLSRYNDTQSVDFRIANMAWEPYHPLTAYHTYAADKVTAFRYRFDRARTNKFKRLTSSPLVNDEVNALVERMLQYTPMGVDAVPDFLSLTYYAGMMSGEDAPANPSLEIQDAYVRLDRSIAELLELLDAKIGLRHILLFVTGAGNADGGEADGQTYRIPTGDFYLNRCAALLNMYLIATYGDGQYVEAYHGQQIYLNAQLIEQRGLSLTEIQDKSAEFLTQFAGVREAYSAHRLLSGAWSPTVQRVRNGFFLRRSGDLLIEVMPGWRVVNETLGTAKVIRQGYMAAPLIFAGFDVAPATLHAPVEMACIAPTLAYYLRIRAPNAATCAPLTDLRE